MNFIQCAHYDVRVHTYEADTTYAAFAASDKNTHLRPMPNRPLQIFRGPVFGPISSFLC